MQEQIELTMQPDEKSDMNGLSYEEAVHELEQIVQKLERGDVPLEESGKLYERGVKLSAHCTGILQKMEEQMSRLSAAPDGRLQEEPLEID